jgi:hypothetical protein
VLVERGGQALARLGRDLAGGSPQLAAISARTTKMGRAADIERKNLEGVRKLTEM